VTLASAGADIVLLDNCDNESEGLPYLGASESDLIETTAMIQDKGRKCLAIRGDVRNRSDVANAVAETVAAFGHLDILCANAGISNHYAKIADIEPQHWDDVVETNLTGVFNSMSAVLPHMVERRYGRIIATSSMAGRAGYAHVAPYSASKWGIIGLVKTAANEYAREGITVNAVCPTTVNTKMIEHDGLDGFICPDIPNPTRQQVLDRMSMMHPMGVPYIEPIDVSRVVLFLASEEARYMSGEVLTVSAASSAMNLG
jgi:NAD(P)-dependent dehydrogenase (short-subunit alcohol dehydrogenase family)